jgi:signal transduction histidine kinase
MRLLLLSADADEPVLPLLAAWDHEVRHVLSVEEAAAARHEVDGFLMAGTSQEVAEAVARLRGVEVRPRPFLLALIPASEHVHLDALLAAAVDDFLVVPFLPVQLQARLEWLGRRRQVGMQALRLGPSSRGVPERMSAIIETQNDVATAGLELEKVMQLIAERARLLCHASGASVALVEGEELVYRVTVGSSEPYRGFRLKLSQSLTGMSILRREVLHTRDTENDPRVNVKATRDTDTRGMIIVPLQRSGSTVGVLNVIYQQPNAYDDLDVRTLELMGQLLGAAMSNAAEFAAKQALVGELATALEDRKQMQARLLVADRLASVGTLAAGVAHEINNPMAFILSNLRFLEDECRQIQGEMPSDWIQEMQDALQETQEGAERVRQIVRDLQTFSRDEGEQLTWVDVGGVLEASLGMVRSELRHRGAHVVKHVEPVPPVWANEARLGQVFLHLLINATQALSSSKPDQNEVRVQLRAEPGRVVIEVADNGCGIPPELHDRIFDPFFTTRTSREGVGLGLSICHVIVTGLGGHIEVESEVGQGTTFRVTLPVTQEARSRARPEGG